MQKFYNCRFIHGQDLRTANEKKNFPPHDEIFVILPPLLRVSPGGNSPTPRSKILSSTPGRIIFTPPIGSKISFYPPYLIKNFIFPPLNCKFVITPRRILPPPSGPTTCPCMQKTCPDTQVFLEEQVLKRN